MCHERRARWLDEPSRRKFPERVRADRPTGDLALPLGADPPSSAARREGANGVAHVAENGVRPGRPERRIEGAVQKPTGV